MATRVPPALKRLFSSSLRVKALSHFFMHPGESFHVRGIAGILEESAGTLARELTNLEAAGVLASRAVGNQKRYSLCKDSPIHDDLRNIFLKTTGAGEELRKALQKLPGVELAFIYGSFASGDAHPASDIDLMVIGDVSDRKLAPPVARVERLLGREVSYTVYAREEARKRLGRKGDFVHEIFSGRRIVVIGGADDGLFRAT